MFERKYSSTISFPTTYTSPRGLLLEGGDDVQKVNMVPIYWLGNSIGNLWQALSFLTGPNLIKSTAWNARGYLEYIVKSIGALPLSQKAAHDLITLMDEIFIPKASESHDSAPATEDVLSTEDAFRIQAGILNFQAVLASELEPANLYYVEGIRAYDMTVLINNGQWILSQGTLKTLSLSENKDRADKVLRDVCEAAKCLAFGLPTACGFHIFRAVEAVTLMYFPILDIPYPPDSKKGLGTYTNLLNGKTFNGKKDRPNNPFRVDNKITDMLDRLRRFYRNPLAHPELSLDYEEAASTFQVAITAIEVMIKDIAAWQLSDTINECWGNISHA